ncbi:ATP-binding protein [Paraglaciecola sp.]|uniref:ATP-binding protein n=1 Tax=Paraglaciecola sp. TaxID=1920173 RepID=UPI003EF9E88A
MKLQNKLFLLLFGFSLLLVTVLIMLMQWSIGKGMVEYVNTKEIETLSPVVKQLVIEYQGNNSWQNLEGNHSRFRQLISNQLKGSDFDSRQGRRPPKRFDAELPDRNQSFRPDQPEYRPGKPPPRGEKRGPPPPEDGAHYALLSFNKSLVAGKYLSELEYTTTPILVGEKTVGYLAVSKRHDLAEGYEVDFIQQQEHYLWLIGLVCMLLVVCVTFPLASHIVRPIKLITSGMHKLTQGDYQQSIQLKREDELGELSRDFNELALTLVENESTRKRWLANISHELRTPLAILRGELEAMLDQVRPMNSDNVGSAYDETKHLQRLIDDLNLLTSADIGGMQYRKSNQNLVTLIRNELDKNSGYLSDAGITMHFSSSVENLDLYCDKTRLCQLFENIINNCVKYSSGSRLQVNLALISADRSTQACEKDLIQITFADDGVGVEEQHLPHLFEHLYRVDDSRNRQTGGSGLGLSICRHIVTAHQGELTASKSSLGGLAIIISLPVTQ